MPVRGHASRDVGSVDLKMIEQGEDSLMDRDSHRYWLFGLTFIRVCKIQRWSCASHFGKYKLTSDSMLKECDAHASSYPFQYVTLMSMIFTFALHPHHAALFARLLGGKDHQMRFEGFVWAGEKSARIVGGHSFNE